MIDRIDFLKNVAEQFEQTTYSELSYDHNIRDLDEWSSLVGLGVLAMIRDIYHVNLYVKDLESVHTIEELYQVVCEKCIE